MSKSKRILSFVLATIVALMPSAGALAATTVGNNVSVGGTLAATGAATLSSTLGVTGLSTLTGGFISSASSSVGAGLQVAGALSASGTLGVAGAAVLASTLSVASLATLTSGFISNASSSIAGGLNVNGNLSVSSTLTLGGNITPDGNNTRSIGAFGAALSNVYVSGTLFAPNTALILNGGFMTNASSSIAGGLSVNGNLSVSSTMTLGGNIIPNTNNSRDLGAYGNAFQNIYASSSLFAVSSTIANATITSTLFLNSGNAQAGGRIIFKGANGATCYQLYFGEAGTGGGIGLTTSTIACPNP